MPAVDCDPHLPPPIRSERCCAVAKPDDGGVVSGVSAGLVSALLSISRLTLTGPEMAEVTNGGHITFDPNYREMR